MCILYIFLAFCSYKINFCQEKKVSLMLQPHKRVLLTLRTLSWEGSAEIIKRNGYLRRKGYFYDMAKLPVKKQCNFVCLSKQTLQQRETCWQGSVCAAASPCLKSCWHASRLSSMSQCGRVLLHPMAWWMWTSVQSFTAFGVPSSLSSACLLGSMSTLLSESDFLLGVLCLCVWESEPASYLCMDLNKWQVEYYGS